MKTEGEGGRQSSLEGGKEGKRIAIRNNTMGFPFSCVLEHFDVMKFVRASEGP